MSVPSQLQISPSPLRLDGYFIKKLSFSLSEEVEKEGINVLVFSSGLHPQLEQPFIESSPAFSVGFVVSRDAEDTTSYKFSLSIKSIKKKDSVQPYEFEAEMVAYFSWVAGETDLLNLETAIQSSAINIMYSLVREALASATARSPLPALVLPSSRFTFTSPEDEQPTLKKVSSKPKQIPAKAKKSTTKRAKKS